MVNGRHGRSCLRTTVCAHMAQETKRRAAGARIARFMRITRPCRTSEADLCAKDAESALGGPIHFNSRWSEAGLRLITA
jgi:hypothetical protein